jgi:hypothetical protein
MPRGTSGLDAIGPNPQVLAIAVTVTVASAALIALLPALSLGSVRPAEALAGSRGSSGRASRTQYALVVAEIVLAVVLMVGAGAMLRSFLDALGRDRGYDPRGLQAINVSLPFSDDSYLDTTRRARAFNEILERVGAVPGVRAAAATTGFPGSRLGVLGGAQCRCWTAGRRSWRRFTRPAPATSRRCRFRSRAAGRSPRPTSRARPASPSSTSSWRVSLPAAIRSAARCRWRFSASARRRSRLSAWPATSS